MARRKATDKRGGAARVDAVRHRDKRANIPTEELRGFVREDEEKPKTVLYARDPDLDPQLVWKGKDEQDSKPLEVPAVPVYIQEKIHPQAIIEDFKASAVGPREKQADLFSDFNGLPEDFADRVDFYHHEGNWSNRLILGDSLLVMTSLAEKEGLKGRVQMIYIDPPYGIKFGSNWQVSTRKRDVRDGRAEDVVRQPEQIRAFRDTWEKGIHSYLAYLRDRLVVARDLLTESGSIFVQMGDENVHLVRCLMDEVFGTENFMSQILFRKTGGLKSKGLASVGDYLLWYARQKDSVKCRSLFNEKTPGFAGATQFKYTVTEDGQVVELSPSEVTTASSDELVSHDNLTSQGNPVYEYAFHGERFRSNFKPPTPSMDRLALSGRILAMGRTLRYVRRLSDYPFFEINELWDDLAISGFADPKVYVVQTSTQAVARCILMTTDPGDLVLDPTCGSGTTAYVAEQWGRRWITIDTSRVALTLARTRLMAGRFPYYHLADDCPQAAVLRSDEEIKECLRRPAHAGGSAADVRKGFVYKRVPHVTLKSIANNEEIDVTHAKWQPKQDAARGRLNKAVKEKWEEWEVPREAGAKWPKEAKAAHEEFWRLRRERQKEVDASIARRADQEVLYDQPYEDSRRVRVSGPFTVESLSPHRTISVEEKKETAQGSGNAPPVTESGRTQFAKVIIENLKASGVSNRAKGERLRLNVLEPFAGTWIHAAGEYADKDGKSRRVAVCIGPEHSTVGPALVKEAAKEAVQGVGFDLLIVCGFAFDAHVPEEAKRYGKLTVLPAEIDKDLQLGGAYLRKSSGASLFTVYAEPDIEVKAGKDGRLTVQVRGLDVYDPTTGEIRSSSTDDIACWFIDTNYNGESFFVRHAYFTGADEPYDKLKRALRAEVDEAAWSALYSTKSRPFDKPETGKIAIKVINHFGDEVLKVYEV